jgi:hypothetical protein
MTTEDPARFVQFPHPGGEHEMPASGTRPWRLAVRTNPHKRTFLQSPATYRAGIAGADERGEVAFWGEWEGEARLVTRLNPAPHGPRFLCRPDPHGALPRPDDRGTPPQNTDPFVWGEAIRYAACRQDRNHKLRTLGQGSLLLFGSSLGQGFVLDTVLVVGKWVDHHLTTYEHDLGPATSPEHLRTALRPWYGWGSEQTFRLYLGATPEDTLDGMFSFVPCRRVSGSRSGFARPVIELPGLINPNTRMQARCSEAMASRELYDQWRAVSDQVIAAGLSLATRLDFPRSPVRGGGRPEERRSPSPQGI